MTDTLSYGHNSRPEFDPEAALSESERAVLAEDRVRAIRLGTGIHLDDWLAFGPGLSIRRHLAMQLSHTNGAKGKRYSEEFAKLMKRDGLDTADKNTKKMMSHVLWLYDEPERLQTLSALREAMTPWERARLNSPITARQQVEKALRPPPNGAAPPRRANIREKLAETEAKLAAAEARIAELTADLPPFAQFDLQRDKVADLADVAVRLMTRNKFDAFAKVAREKFNAQRQRRRR
jgi:hypothetical protein